MPHRVLRAVLLEIVSACCDDAESAGRVVDRLLEAGLRLPTVTVTDARDLDAIPDGSAVIVSNPHDPSTMPLVGEKKQYSIHFVGDEHPWPFHDPNRAPPLPCTVLWMPGEQLDVLRGIREGA